MNGFDRQFSKSRLEAFSDGVIAIIITLMILEIKIPELNQSITSDTIKAALFNVLPHLTSYLLSFVLIGIYWINHHQLLHLVKAVDNSLLWLNLHFLFWLSLIPFPTSLLGELPLRQEPVAVYGAVCLGASFSYMMLFLKCSANFDQRINERYRLSALIKNAIGLALYILAIGVSKFNVYFSWAIFIAIPASYFFPDKAEVKS